jgi:hypothetical protein
MSGPNTNGVDHFDGWPALSPKREILNKCEPCAMIGRARSAKVSVRLEDGELQDVCAAHFIEWGDGIRSAEWFE